MLISAVNNTKQMCLQKVFTELRFLTTISYEWCDFRGRYEWLHIYKTVYFGQYGAYGRIPPSLIMKVLKNRQ